MKTPTKTKTLTPENNQQTGVIDMTNHGVVFKSHNPKWIRWAFSPIKGSTQWFLTYAEAKTALFKAVNDSI
jgi:hypothetical protein